MKGLCTHSVDQAETRKQVYKLFGRYQYLLNLLPLDVTPKLTQEYSYIPPSTKRALNSIEFIAHKNLEREKLEYELQNLTTLISEGLANLNSEERMIIVRRYLLQEQHIETDWQIYNDLHIGRSKYYEMKRNAINKLAFQLGMEVYK